MSNNKPNIVFIFPDQLRADFLGCYGADFLKTPNIDSLAENGVLYEKAYSASPVCVPARTSLLTGLNPYKHGITGNWQAVRPDYKITGIKTWADIINDQGYYTSAVGKMHFYPWDARHGFEYRSIAEDKRHLHVRDDYFKYLRSAGYRKYHGNEHDGYHENIGAVKSIVPYEYSWDHFVGKEACRFIDNYGKDGPFAMMIGFPGPHDPYDPSEDFGDIPSEDSVPEPIPIYEHDEPHVESQNDKGRAEWADLNFNEMNGQDSKKKRKMRAHYAGLVQQIDSEVGEIIKSLEKNNLIDNTVIFFATDHGDHLGDHGLFKFGEMTFHEATAHIPLIVRTPDTVNNPKRSNQLVYLYDITSTILTLAGAEIPSYYDSKPLPDIPGIDSRNRDILFGLQPHGWMAYDGTWKLSKYRNGVRTLFNMDDDKNETKNLYDNPENFVLRSELEAKLSTEIMDSINFSVFDRMVDTKNSLNETDYFGKEGWEWNYPASPIRKFGMDSASDSSKVNTKKQNKG